MGLPPTSNYSALANEVAPRRLVQLTCNQIRLLIDTRESALAQKQTWPHVCLMSALTLEADIDWSLSHVRFVPLAADAPQQKASLIDQCEKPNHWHCRLLRPR
jgi:hypothetical protein